MSAFFNFQNFIHYMPFIVHDLFNFNIQFPHATTVIDTLRNLSLTYQEQPTFTNSYAKFL